MNLHVPHRWSGAPRSNRSGSFTQRACAMVAACAACVMGVTGCLTTQELGAEDGGARVDVGADDETGGGGFDPKLVTSDPDLGKCPGIPPQGGLPCPSNFHVDGPSPVQCSYRVPVEHARSLAGSFGMEAVICGTSCVCAFDNHWSCIDAPCALPSKRVCSEGMPCVDRVGCTLGCITGVEPSCRKCACVDERLSCGAVPTK